MKQEILEARARFMSTYNGTAPNMLVISHEAWWTLCGELEPQYVMMNDRPPHRAAQPVMGMQTYLSADAEGFVVGMSLGREA